MTIEKARENGTITLAIKGRLDTSTSPRFQEKLIPLFDEAKAVKIDFTNVAYVSSAGLRVLLMGQKTARSRNAAMTLFNVSEEVMEVFDMTGFSDMLTIE